MLLKTGQQRALRAELVEPNCFPLHLLYAKQYLYNQIIFCKEKLRCVVNKNNSCEMYAVKPPATCFKPHAWRSSRKFFCGGCEAQAKAH